MRITWLAPAVDIPVHCSQLTELPFLALNPEDASRRRLEAKPAEHGVSLSVSIHTP
jgi:hypothetical protein